MSLKMKLNAGFGAILLILIILSGSSLYSVQKMSEAAAEVSERSVRQAGAFRMAAAIESQLTGVRGYVLSGRENLLDQDEEGKKKYQAEMEEMSKSTSHDEDQRLQQDIQSKYGEYRTVLDTEIQLRRAGKTKEAVDRVFSQATLDLRGQLGHAVTAFLDFEENQKALVMKRQNGVQEGARTMVTMLSLLGLAVGVALSILLTRSLSGRLSGMLHVIEQIAANNLAIADLDVSATDDVGKASLALNAMKNNLRRLLEAIAETAGHVASASQELSATSSEQASGAETQKDQSTQVSIAMQEMAKTVSEVTENSRMAADASRLASDTARRGGAMVEQTLVKMRAIAEGVRDTGKKVEELGKASDKIGPIVGVIDDIADQTNLLALNAAIEAARAGEQGRGFAVVADEVRKLAERTTSATKEIAQMITSIQGETRVAVVAMEAGTQKVEEGVTSTALAGDVLKEIIRVADEAGEMVSRIATAATEQSSATEQVNQNMDQITRVIKESAVGSQQAAMACQDLSRLAVDLQKMVGRFELERGRSHPQGHSGSESSGAGHGSVTSKMFAASAG